MTFCKISFITLLSFGATAIVEIATFGWVKGPEKWVRTHPKKKYSTFPSKMILGEQNVLTFDILAILTTKCCILGPKSAKICQKELNYD